MGLADNYAFAITFPMQIWRFSIAETWFWAIALIIATLWVLSIKTTTIHNKIDNKVTIDEKALKGLQKALKTSETPNIEEDSE